MAAENNTTAVVPGYYLVCYNHDCTHQCIVLAVVPGYYLVCYNHDCTHPCIVLAVVPGYYLVCYNCVPCLHLK